MDLIRNSILKDEQNRNKRILVIGVGAIGSHLVAELVKLGFKNITVYDTGLVKEHNLTNQLYSKPTVGMPKVEALSKLISTRYEVDILTPMTLDFSMPYDVVFNCVDVASARREYREKVRSPLFIETAFDVYSSDLVITTDQRYRNMIPTVDGGSTSEVTSACGSRLSVSASITGFIGFTVWALINHLNGDLEADMLNKRLTFMSFNPIAVTELTEQHVEENIEWEVYDANVSSGTEQLPI